MISTSSSTPRLTILTGPNGGGKSSLLSILAIDFETQPAWASVPRYLSGKFGYSPAIIVRKLVNMRKTKLVNGGLVTEIGQIEYAGVAKKCSVYAPSWIGDPLNTQGVFTLAIDKHKPVVGCHISTIRPLPLSYELKTLAPVERTTPADLLQQLNAIIETKIEDLGRILKKQLVAHAPYDLPPGIAHSYPPEWFKQFLTALQDALPPELGFQMMQRRELDLVLLTEHGEFSYDACSSGIKSIIFICWKLTLASQIDEAFTCTLDEPECHLHPAMQQTFMNSLLKNFPLAQFIVATHSPFTITSAQNSSIYAIRFRAEGVVSELIEEQNLKSATPDEVLKEVLGLPYTMPIWAASNLEKIVARYTNEPLSEPKMLQMVRDLKSAGLGEFFPESLKMLQKKNTDDKNN